MKLTTNQISISATKVTRVLGAVAFLLVLASMAAFLTTFFTRHDHLYGLIPLFRADLEQNVPTFFSTSLLLFATLLLVVIAILKRKQAAAYASHWVFLSFGFLYLAADEAASIHELMSLPARKLWGSDSLGVFYFTWVIPAIAVILIVAPFFLRFLWHLPSKTRRWFLIAATLYLGGAIGFELVEGRIAEVHKHGYLAYGIMVALEEGLEMVGVIVFVYALLGYLADNYKEVGIKFEGRNAREL